MEKIKEILNNDGVISFVTDTVWGLGCLPTSKKAVEKIYEIKGRDKSKPLILMSNSLEYLKPYIKDLSQMQKKFLQNYFPGAVTLIVDKSELTPLFMTAQQETVGIRIPNNKVFNKLCEVIDGHVLATTSANLSGQPAAISYQEAMSFVGDKVDYILPNEEDPAQGLASTVALIKNNEIKILRQGVIDIEMNDYSS